MSLEVFGDEGDGMDLIDECTRLGYEPWPQDEAKFWNLKDDTDGDTVKTEEEMWQYIEDRHDEDMEDQSGNDYYYSD